MDISNFVTKQQNCYNFSLISRQSADDCISVLNEKTTFEKYKYIIMDQAVTSKIIQILLQIYSYWRQNLMSGAQIGFS